MSKIGRIPVKIVENVKVEFSGKILKVTGPKGEFELMVPGKIKLDIKPDLILVTRTGDDKISRSLHGLWRVLIFNCIKGVSEGWDKKLDFKGVGFRAEVQENTLVLNVGFSHAVNIQAPEGISFQVVKNVITVSGIDKQKVGQTAAEIRQVRPVEPYKGKGIKYVDEIPRRKLGKAAKAAAGGTGK